MTLTKYPVLDGRALIAHADQGVAVTVKTRLAPLCASGEPAYPGPPIFVARLAVQDTVTRDRDISLPEGIDQWRIIHALRAFVAREDHGVILGIGAEEKAGSLSKMQVHVVVQMNGAGEKVPFGDNDPTATSRAARGDRLLDCVRGVCFAVGQGAVSCDVPIAAWK